MADDVALSIQNVYKSFRLPHERHSGLKQLIVNFHKRGKGYEVQEVIKGVSVDIKKGEFFGIVGKNGSGKSTLLKLLAGIYTPTEGHVQVNGSLTPFIELGVGFNPELTGRENVFLNGALLGFDRQQMEAMYDDIVEFAELKRFMDQKLKNYSSGMQVRLAFSIAIRANSDILLLDEVLAVGDSRFQQKCFDYFYNLKRNKKTVVFVSHDLDAVQKFCSNGILLENGEVTASGNIRSIVDKYQMDNFRDEAEAQAKKKAKEKAEEKKPEKNPLEVTEFVIGDASLKLTGDEVLEIDEKLKLNYEYELIEDREIELRIALVKDGIGFAHINTKGLSLPHTKGRHSIEVEVGVESLMHGEHTINCGINDAHDGKQLFYDTKVVNFYIQTDDNNRLGFNRLSDHWSIKE